LLPGRLVDASGVMWAARRIKSDEEVACVRAACAVAEAGLSAVVEAARRPGVSRGELVGAFDERIASLGVTTPSLDVLGGDLLRLHAAVLYQGYEGGLGRTLGCSPGETERWQAAFDQLVDTCRPGATGADLVAAWTSTGEDLPPPSTPLVHGVGLGVEPPVIGAGIGGGAGATAVLDAGMVLAVQGQVGSYFGKETVLVHSDGPEVLTRFPILV
jgi:Xaa-Pro aminopeptidase